MAVQVAELVAKLVFDITGFKTGIQQAGQEGAKLTDAVTKNASAVSSLKQQIEQTQQNMRKLITDGISPTSKGFEQLQSQYDKQVAALSALKGQVSEAGKAAGQAASGPFSALKDSLSSLGSEGTALAGRFAPVVTSLGAFGLALGAASLVARSSLDAWKSLTSQVKDLAFISGGSLEEISKLSHGLEVMGVSSESTERAMNKMSQAASTGDAAFARIGVSLLGSNNRIKSGIELFYETIDALHNMSNEVERNRAGWEIFGRGWLSMGPLIQRGSDALREFSAETKKIVTQEDVQRLREYNAAMTKLGDEIDSIKMEVARGIVVPIVIPGIETLRWIIEEIRGLATQPSEFDLSDENIKKWTGSRKPAAIPKSAQTFDQALLSIGTSSGTGPGAPEIPPAILEQRLKYQSELLKLRSQLVTVMGPAITEEQKYAEAVRVTDLNAQLAIQTLKDMLPIEREQIQLRYRQGEFGAVGTAEAEAKRDTLLKVTVAKNLQDRQNIETAANAQREQLTATHNERIARMTLDTEEEWQKTSREAWEAYYKFIADQQKKAEEDLKKYLDTVKKDMEDQEDWLKTDREAWAAYYKYLQETSPEGQIKRQQMQIGDQQSRNQAERALKMGGAGFIPKVQLQDQLVTIQRLSTMLPSSQFDALTERITATRNAIQGMVAQMDNVPEDMREKMLPAIEELRSQLAELQKTSELRDAFRSLFDGISNGLTTSINGVIQGTQILSDAFKNMARNIALSISNLLINGALKDLERSLENVLFSGQSAQGGKSLVGSGIGSLFNWVGSFFASGGVVTKPTMAMLGEAGPEIVLNKTQFQSLPLETQKAILDQTAADGGSAGRMLSGGWPSDVDAGGGRPGVEGNPSVTGPLSRSERQSLGYFGRVAGLASPYAGIAVQSMLAASWAAEKLGVTRSELYGVDPYTAEDIANIADYQGYMAAEQARQANETARASAPTRGAMFGLSSIPDVLRDIQTPAAAELGLSAEAATTAAAAGYQAGFTGPESFGGSIGDSGLGIGGDYGVAGGSWGEPGNYGGWDAGSGSGADVGSDSGGYGGGGYGDAGGLAYGGFVPLRSRRLVGEAGPELRFRLQGLDPIRRQALIDALPHRSRKRSLSDSPELATRFAVPAFAEGAMVTKPTLALFGEAGPEAVIPLRRSTASGGQPVVQQILNVSPGVPEAVRREIAALRPMLKRDAVDAVAEARNRGGSMARLLGERGK